MADLNLLQLRQLRFFVPPLTQKVTWNQMHQEFPPSVLDVQSHQVNASSLYGSLIAVAIRMLRQRSDVSEIVRQSPNRLVDVSVPRPDASLGIHAFPECGMGSGQIRHRVLRCRALCTVQSSTMVIFPTRDTSVNIYLQNFLRLRLHHCHLRSIHNLDEQVVSCR